MKTKSEFMNYHTFFVTFTYVPNQLVSFIEVTNNTNNFKSRALPFMLTAYYVIIHAFRGQ